MMAPRHCVKRTGPEEALAREHRTRVRFDGEGFLAPPLVPECSCGWEGSASGSVASAEATNHMHLVDVGVVPVPKDRPGLKIKKYYPRPDLVVPRSAPDGRHPGDR